MSQVCRDDAGNFVFCLSENGGDRYSFKAEDVRGLINKGGCVPALSPCGRAILQVHPMAAEVMLVIPGSKVYYGVARGALQQMLYQAVSAPLTEREGLCFLCNRLQKIEFATNSDYLWVCSHDNRVLGGKTGLGYTPPRKCCV